MITFMLNIGYIAGGILGIGIIWRMVVKPLYGFIGKLEQVHEIILTFPEWRRQVNAKIDTQTKDMGELKKLIEAHISDESAH